MAWSLDVLTSGGALLDGGRTKSSHCLHRVVGGNGDGDGTDLRRGRNVRNEFVLRVLHRCVPMSYQSRELGLNYFDKHTKVFKIHV